MPKIIKITDFSASELDVYARFSEAQLLHIYEPNLGLFIAESPKVAMRALDAGYEPVSVLVELKQIEGEAKELIDRIQNLELAGITSNVPIYTAEFDVLTKLTGFQLTRGLLCAMKRKTLSSVEDVCRNAKRIVILEDVVNPTNVGAIFRSAAALGMDGILLTKACSDPLYRRSERVSMGTVFQIPWTFLDCDYEKYHNSNHEKYPDSNHQVNDSCHYLDKIKELGFKTVAMALQNDSVDIDDPMLHSEEKLAIIMGTEGDGLSMNTITLCDYTVCIPMHYGVDSLNVAAASAIAFWQLGHH